mgnify:CR=1 FL=1
MFGKSRRSLADAKDEKIAALEKEVAELKATLAYVKIDTQNILAAHARDLKELKELRRGSPAAPSATTVPPSSGADRQWPSDDARNEALRTSSRGGAGAGENLRRTLNKKYTKIKRRRKSKKRKSKKRKSRRR